MPKSLLTSLAEYIGQLEGEVAMKAQEASNLRGENQALMQENDRYRGLIETLLRHPAFTPFINDISKDPSVLGAPPASHAASQHGPAQNQSTNSAQQPSQAQQQQQQHQQQQQPPPQQQQEQQQHQRQQAPDIKPDFLNFDVTQIQVPQQADQHINLATIPENDFSKLDLNGFQRAVDFNQYRSVNAFPVTELPFGPDPEILLSAPPTYPYTLAPTANHSTMLPNQMNMLLSRLEGAARRVDYSS